MTANTKEDARAFPGKVWNTLSKIDVTHLIEKKGGLDYLSWANAWALLMNEFPESEFERGDPRIQPNGTVEVTVSVLIVDGDNRLLRSMWLPVMNNRNQAIVDPTSRDLNDAYMRCLVKCLGLFGLGLSLYRGEIAVSETKVHEPAEKPAKKMATEEQMVRIRDYFEAGELPEATIAYLEKNEWKLSESQASKLLGLLSGDQEEAK